MSRSQGPPSALGAWAPPQQQQQHQQQQPHQQQHYPRGYLPAPGGVCCVAPWAMDVTSTSRTGPLYMTAQRISGDRKIGGGVEGDSTTTTTTTTGTTTSSSSGSMGSTPTTASGSASASSSSTAAAAAIYPDEAPLLCCEKKIRTVRDLGYWMSSNSYSHYVGFLRRLSLSVVDKKAWRTVNVNTYTTDVRNSTCSISTELVSAETTLLTAGNNISHATPATPATTVEEALAAEGAAENPLGNTNTTKTTNQEKFQSQCSHDTGTTKNKSPTTTTSSTSTTTTSSGTSPPLSSGSSSNSETSNNIKGSRSSSDNSNTTNIVATNNNSTSTSIPTTNTNATGVSSAATQVPVWILEEGAYIDSSSKSSIDSSSCGYKDTSKSSNSSNTSTSSSSGNSGNRKDNSDKEKSSVTTPTEPICSGTGNKDLEAIQRRQRRLSAEGLLTPPAAATASEELIELALTTRYAEAKQRAEALAAAAIKEGIYVSEAIVQLLVLLQQLLLWVEDIKPVEQPMRFGNKAFRSWLQRLETCCQRLLTPLIPALPQPPPAPMLCETIEEDPEGEAAEAASSISPPPGVSTGGAIESASSSRSFSSSSSSSFSFSSSSSSLSSESVRAVLHSARAAAEALAKSCTGRSQSSNNSSSTSDTGNTSSTSSNSNNPTTSTTSSSSGSSKRAAAPIIQAPSTTSEEAGPPTTTTTATTTITTNMSSNSVSPSPSASSFSFSPVSLSEVDEASKLRDGNRVASALHGGEKIISCPQVRCSNSSSGDDNHPCSSSSTISKNNNSTGERDGVSSSTAIKNDTRCEGMQKDVCTSNSRNSNNSGSGSHTTSSSSKSGGSHNSSSSGSSSSTGAIEGTSLPDSQKRVCTEKGVNSPCSSNNSHSRHTNNSSSINNNNSDDVDDGDRSNNNTRSERGRELHEDQRNKKNENDKIDDQAEEYFVRKELLKELIDYLCHSFGDGRRLDYGTGHEASFALFLLVLFEAHILREGVDDAATVLLVFTQYVEVCHALQRRYSLEPAGSRGAWGLDDFHFLPFLFGSAQLQDQHFISPAQVIEPAVVQEMAPHNLYFSSIEYILQTKRGAPFSECAPMLYDISGISSCINVVVIQKSQLPQLAF